MCDWIIYFNYIKSVLLWNVTTIVNFICLCVFWLQIVVVIMNVFLVMESRLSAPVTVATFCTMTEKHAVSY